MSVDKNGSYVLVTPARNEENYIEKTISSVISQTLKPRKWIIVSDGSTDRTDEIVKKYALDHEFIQLEAVASSNKRNFASKVAAFNKGYALLKDMDYEFIGNLDADVSFNPDYFEKILQEFQRNPVLGIAGGWIWEPQDGIFMERGANTTRSVPGAIQLFRRKCFEDIDGYIPVTKGGIDTVAEIKALGFGWLVESFPQRTVLHYRRTSAGKKNVFLTRFCQGEIDYILSVHLFYQLVKLMYRTKEKPYLLGSLLRLSGYCWAFLHHEKQILPENIVIDLQTREKIRVKDELLNIIPWRRK